MFKMFKMKNLTEAKLPTKVLNVAAQIGIKKLFTRMDCDVIFQNPPSLI